MKLTRRTLIVAASGAALATTASCTASKSDPSPTPTPSTVAPYPSDSPQQRVEITTVVSSLGGLVDAYESHLTPTMVLASGSDARGDACVAADLTSGKTLWSLRSDDPRWRTDLPKGQSLFSTFTFYGQETVTGAATVYVNPCPGDAGMCTKDSTTKTEGWNLIAIDGSTGATKWVSTVMAPIPRDSPNAKNSSAIKVVAGNDDLLLVHIGPAGEFSNSTTPTRTRAITTVALSTATGEQVWKKEQFVSVARQLERARAPADRDQRCGYRHADHPRCQHRRAAHPDRAARGSHRRLGPRRGWSCVAHHRPRESPGASSD